MAQGVGATGAPATGVIAVADRAAIGQRHRGQMAIAIVDHRSLVARGIRGADDAIIDVVGALPEVADRIADGNQSTERIRAERDRAAPSGSVMERRSNPW